MLQLGTCELVHATMVYMIGLRVFKLIISVSKLILNAVAMHDYTLIPVILFSLHHCSSSAQLFLTKFNSEVAQGRYGSVDVGIVFNSTTSSLTITDLFGNLLLAVHESQLDHQWLVVKGNVFVQVYIKEKQQYRDYFVPRSMYRDVNNLSSEFNITLLTFLNALPFQFHYEQLQKSVEGFTDSPYAESIKRTVYILGSELNVYGNIYPSILPLYLVANMLERFRFSVYSTSGKCSIKDSSCFEECPPCPDEECLSLCGYGCHCWKWVCGDCCYHLGCYGHDLCCRKNFIQTKCLFPISFRCESEYEC